MLQEFNLTSYFYHLSKGQENLLLCLFLVLEVFPAKVDNKLAFNWKSIKTRYPLIEFPSEMSRVLLNVNKFSCHLFIDPIFENIFINPRWYK